MAREKNWRGQFHLPDNESRITWLQKCMEIEEDLDGHDRIGSEKSRTEIRAIETPVSYTHLTLPTILRV